MYSSEKNNTYNSFARRRIVKALAEVVARCDQVGDFLGHPDPVVHVWNVAPKVELLYKAIAELQDALRQGQPLEGLEADSLLRDK
jgi:hypothetical protein